MRTDTSESRDWFRLLLEEDPDVFRTLVDAYSVHLYTEGRAPLDTRHAQRWRFDRAHITRDLAAAAGAAHPLWVTEFGWSTYAGDEDSVSEAEQALYTRQALEAAFVTFPPARSSSPSSTTGARCTRGTSAATARCGRMAPRNRCGAP